MRYAATTDNPMPFQQCCSCEAVWRTRDSFLTDPGVSLIGYRSSFSDLLAGMILFRHYCGTTAMIPAGQFADLYDGPVFSARRTGGDTCPGYCLREEELRPCPAQCECAFVREIVHLIDNWPKRMEAARATAAHEELTR